MFIPIHINYVVYILNLTASILFQYYLFKLAKEQLNDNVDKVYKEQVEKALHWAQNIILGKESFEIRPTILHIRMFDEYTNSNAESEHAALKKKSLGIQSNETMTSLFKKTHQEASKKSTQKMLNQNQDLIRTDTNTKCPMSNYLVKYCFNAIQSRLNSAKHCISKQNNAREWILVYQRPTVVTIDHHLHYVPLIQRKRYVTLSDGKSYK